jgi:photosystem II stability/assembly factor-like uncharacterized protein
MRQFVLLTVRTAVVVLGTSTGVLWAGNNEWTSIGPDGGSIQALAVDPQNPGTVYATASDGIFKTTNGGASWTPVSSDLLARFYVTALAIEPQSTGTVYAGTMARSRRPPMEA